LPVDFFTPGVQVALESGKWQGRLVQFFVRNRGGLGLTNVSLEIVREKKLNFYLSNLPKATSKKAFKK
jgi:hypothetical protein